MIRCIIVDDEPLGRDILASHIAGHPDLQLVSQSHSALKAFDILHSQNIELMFLDIKMPGIDGIDFLKSLKHPPKVIFTTAYSEYALSAFDLDAVDYLLKPITSERFEKSMNKLMQISPAAAPGERPYTYFKITGKLIKIYHADLLYVRAVKDYVLLQTTAGSHLTHMSMKAIGQILPAPLFVRVHRSYIVNQTHILEIRKSSIKIDGDILPLGGSYRKNI